MTTDPQSLSKSVRLMYLSVFDTRVGSTPNLLPSSPRRPRFIRHNKKTSSFLNKSLSVVEGMALQWSYLCWSLWNTKQVLKQDASGKKGVWINTCTTIQCVCVKRCDDFSPGTLHYQNQLKLNLVIFVYVLGTCSLFWPFCDVVHHSGTRPLLWY
jgi:hypothetical protein